MSWNLQSEGVVDGWSSDKLMYIQRDECTIITLGVVVRDKKGTNEARALCFS